MKLVCNKQITAVCDLYNTGNGFLVQLNGESLESIAGKMSGLNKSHGRKFPARVTLIIQDISDDQKCIPDMDELAEKIAGMASIMMNDASID